MVKSCKFQNCTFAKKQLSWSKPFKLQMRILKSHGKNSKITTRMCDSCLRFGFARYTGNDLRIGVLSQNIIFMYIRRGQNFPSIWNFKCSSRIWNYMKNVTFCRPGQVPRTNTSFSISFLTFFFLPPQMRAFEEKKGNVYSQPWKQKKKFYTIIFHVFLPLKSDDTFF